MNILIVIPVLNGEKFIEKCLNSILSLKLEEEDIVEIIVMDNGSTDNTLSIVDDKGISCEIIKNCTISRLRNIGGMKKPLSEYIGFIDSDCFICSDWLQNAKKVFSKSEKIGVVGRYYSTSENPTWVENLWVNIKNDIEGPVNFLPGGNMIFNRLAFEKVGGFDENLITGEDYDICSRVKDLGYVIYNSKNVSTIHMGNFKKLIDIIRKERWYGRGMFVKKSLLSKPLLSGLALTFSTLTALIAFPFNSKVSIFFCIIIMIITFVVSIHFSKNIKSGKFLFVIKVFPISLCYLFGRSLSIVDFMVDHIKSK